MRKLFKLIAFLIVIAAITLTFAISAWAQDAAAPTLNPGAAAVLTYFGLGKYAAAIASIVALVGFILTHVMPFVPVPSATAPSWWRAIWQLLSWITGNYGKVVTPMPEKVPDPTPLPAKP